MNAKVVPPQEQKEVKPRTRAERPPANPVVTKGDNHVLIRSTNWEIKIALYAIPGCNNLTPCMRGVKGTDHHGRFVIAGYLDDVTEMLQVSLGQTHKFVNPGNVVMPEDLAVASEIADEFQEIFEDKKVCEQLLTYGIHLDPESVWIR